MKGDMSVLQLNETPVRTSRNFNINNIKIENVEIPTKVKPFTNIKMTGTVDTNVDAYSPTYGLGDTLTSQVKTMANVKQKIKVDETTTEDQYFTFDFDCHNQELIEHIEIVAEENANATIYMKYRVNGEVEGFHNGMIRVIAKDNSTVNLVICNLCNDKTQHFMSIEGQQFQNATVNLTMVDFGGKNSITNVYMNLLGKEAKCNMNTIYLGRQEQVLDLNYIAELRGENTKVNIEVQGALKDKAKKHFKGTIDFKKGCKKAKGNENEYCMLLSDTAKSLALPMLLCSEEEVEGNHSSAAGKVGEKQLFYMMSRGFNLKEAMKLMVKANFNQILETIKDEAYKKQIMGEIDVRLEE